MTSFIAQILKSLIMDLVPLMFSAVVSFFKKKKQQVEDEQVAESNVSAVKESAEKGDLDGLAKDGEDLLNGTKH